MKFLQDHVQRRRTFTNISQKKDKENVTTKVPHSNLNLAIHRPTVSTTSTTRPVFCSISPNSLTNCAIAVKQSGNIGLLNTMESTNYKTHFNSSISETPTVIERTEESSSESSALSQGFSTPSIASQCDRCYLTPRKRQKPESDDIEKSFLSLSTTIADKIRNSNTQTQISKSNKIEKDPEDKFAELIAIELKQLPEEERKEKKRRIIDILWN
ncbi:hypothetical protein DMN91_012000 [Ooceraea biroi]|uniref:BESS domain-containing protein n=1 Tax=Ooceraea biroi TaxID=2015173 RepID=A0A3L8D717_OOCBI|nr:uncharacterized protein LOC105287111 [Ooceraea biroi]RLU16240.1 hypothetical protein DMN91_012000 [Ooceraea biroi]